MANVAFGSKYFIFSKLRTIPRTSGIETERAGLLKEFNDLIEFENSAELKDFLTLGRYLESKEYQALKTSIESEKNKELGKIKLYETTKKSKAFRDFFKFRESQKLKDHLTFLFSKELKDFEDIEKVVTSKKFEEERKVLENKKNTEEQKVLELNKLKKSKIVRSYLQARLTEDKQKNEKFTSNPEIKKFLDLEKYIESPAHKDTLISVTKSLTSVNTQIKEYHQKKKSNQIKVFYRFKNSQKYKSFQSFEKSKELADYLALEKYLLTDEHKNHLKALNEKEKVENDKKVRYESFKASKKYKWYIGLKDTAKFDELKKWELIFEDDFTGNQLDRKKWLTRYYWGEKLIKDAYAFESDKAFPTDGKNLEYSNSHIKIVTRQEKAQGKMWKPPFGFIPTDFNYTTGMISTAGSHRQKYGRIEAKIKINYSKPVDYHFWMASPMNLPHVDILKVAGKKSKVDMANLYGNVTAKKSPEKKTGEFSGLDVSQDFFIYTLDWTKDKLTWKINGITVNEQTQGIPQEEMYLVFSCGITGKTDGLGLPVSMDIDWIRCYKRV